MTQPKKSRSKSILDQAMPHLKELAKATATAAATEGVRAYFENQGRMAAAQQMGGLPAQGGPDPWPYYALGVAPGTSLGDCEDVYRWRAKEAHPDLAGGSEAVMKQLNRAIEELRARAKA